MIPVGQLAPGDQWDQNLLDRLFANEIYPTGLEFKRSEGYPNTDGAIMIIPGRYWAGHEREIGTALSRCRWVLAMRTSDEEDLFDIHKVDHPNVQWWVQTPRTDCDYGDARLFGVGFPRHFNNLPADPPEKTLDVFLSAQRTHMRRQQAFDALGDTQPDRYIEATEAFTRGVPPVQYADLMASAKVAPAPSGAESPDSFRLWEALEAHAVPIADDVSPVYDSRGFWEKLYPGAPFPILTDYADLPGYIGDVLKDWPASANRVAAWWIQQKRSMAQWLRDDLETLGAL